MPAGNPTPDNRSQDRSQERFLALFLASEQELFRYVAAITPSLEDAREVVQQTAVVLWQKFDQYDLSQPFTPLACRFALNITKQWLARKKRWQSILADDVAETIAKRRIELMPAMDSRLRFLDGCLEKLSTDQRRIIEGYYFRQLGVDGVAKESHRTVDAVYKAMQRIRRLLQDCIERAEQAEAVA
jgi:RNA polymerase sigma-70 factor (ECF subfamily)